VTSSIAAEIKELRREVQERCHASKILQAGFEFICGGARQPTRQIVEFVDTNRDGFGVEPICRTLQLAPFTTTPLGAGPDSKVDETPPTSLASPGAGPIRTTLSGRSGGWVCRSGRGLHRRQTEPALGGRPTL
jgi:hypothetical protein